MKPQGNSFILILLIISLLVNLSFIFPMNKAEEKSAEIIKTAPEIKELTIEDCTLMSEDAQVRKDRCVAVSVAEMYGIEDPSIVANFTERCIGYYSGGITCSGYLATLGVRAQSDCDAYFPSKREVFTMCLSEIK